jgi:hypothetical protein
MQQTRRGRSAGKGDPFARDIDCRTLFLGQVLHLQHLAGSPYSDPRPNPHDGVALPCGSLTLTEQLVHDGSNLFVFEASDDSDDALIGAVILLISAAWPF